MTTVGTTYNANQVCVAGARTVTDLSAKEGYFVKPVTAHADGIIVGLTAAVTDKPLGVLRKGALGTAAAPKAVEVVYLGETQVVAGAAVAVGAHVQADGAGKAITAAATGYRCGIALTSCTADGEIITVAICCPAASLVA